MVAAPWLRGSDYEDQKVTYLGFLVMISFVFFKAVAVGGLR